MYVMSLRYDMKNAIELRPFNVLFGNCFTFGSMDDSFQMCFGSSLSTCPLLFTTDHLHTELRCLSSAGKSRHHPVFIKGDTFSSQPPGIPAVPLPVHRTSRITPTCKKRCLSTGHSTETVWRVTMTSSTSVTIKLFLNSQTCITTMI